MKRHILAACAIAIGSLGLAAPKALADGSSATHQVPFAGVAAGVCLIDTVVPVAGTLTNVGSPDTLSTVTPGFVTYFCNDDTKVSVAAPQQVDIALAGEEVTGTLTSSISSITNNGLDLGLTAIADVEVDLLPGTNVIAVNMEAVDDDGVIKAGAYAFEVPITITCL